MYRVGENYFFAGRRRKKEREGSDRKFVDILTGSASGPFRLAILVPSYLFRSSPPPPLPPLIQSYVRL